MAAPRVYLPASLGDLRAFGDEDPYERGAGFDAGDGGAEFLRPTQFGCRSPLFTGAGASIVR